MADKGVIGFYCNYYSSCFELICSITKLIIFIYVSRLGHLHSFTIIIQKWLDVLQIYQFLMPLLKLYIKEFSNYVYYHKQFGSLHIITAMLLHINFQLIHLFSKVYGKTSWLS